MTRLAAVSLPVKALAFVVFVAAVAGATWGVDQLVGGEAKLAAVSAKVEHASLNATAGHVVSYAVTVVNRDTDELQAVARLSAPGGIEGVSPVARVPSDASLTVFVPVTIPPTATPGDVPLALTLVDANGLALREKAGAATLRVLPPGEGFAPGETARVRYAGRLADGGLVFDTNEPTLAGLSFAHTDTFDPSSVAGRPPLPIQTTPRPSVIAGFYEGLLGMQVGESRTVTFPAEKAYGPALEQTTEPRDESLDATFEVPRDVEEVGRDVFDDCFQTGGRCERDGATEPTVGGTFLFNDPPNQWRYRILDMDERTVEYQLEVAPGEKHTLYPFWEDGSLVESANATHIVFRTSPTTGVGETFTMRSHWPNMSAVKEVSGDTILVRHSPPEGLKYTVRGGGMQPPRDYTVQTLNETTIVSATPSAHPLAGKALTFDILLLERTS